MPKTTKPGNAGKEQTSVRIQVGGYGIDESHLKTHKPSAAVKTRKNRGADFTVIKAGRTTSHGHIVEIHGKASIKPNAEGGLDIKADKLVIYEGRPVFPKPHSRGIILWSRQKNKDILLGRKPVATYLQLVEDSHTIQINYLDSIFDPIVRILPGTASSEEIQKLVIEVAKLYRIANGESMGVNVSTNASRE